MLYKVSNVIGLKKELSPGLQSNSILPMLSPQTELEFFMLDELCKRPITFYHKNIKKQLLSENIKNSINNSDKSKNVTKIISDDVLTDRGKIGTNKKWYINVQCCFINFKF